jgi:Outer membrane protein beta-barrel domain
MNKFFAIVAVLVSSVLVCNAQTASQDAEVIKTKKSIFTTNTTYSKPSKDYVMLQAGFHTWLLPNDTSINLKQKGHDLNAYICYDFPLQKKHFSFAPGIGIATSSIYLDSMTMNLGGTDPNVKFTYGTGGYKRYKYATAYIEAPFEFRYYANSENRNRGFKAALGVKVGNLLNAHTKAVNTSSVKVKENSRRYNEQWRLALTARMGYGNFSIYGSYQFNSVFKAGNIQGISPISIGFCLSGL